MLLPPEPEFSAHVLGFDTSTERLAVGLHVPGGARLPPRRGDVDAAAPAPAPAPFCVNCEGGARASALLLPQVHALLARAGVALSAVDFIACGRGPGAFTGLRTACAVAQGLAYGLGKPVLLLDSLMIVAEDARAQLAADGAGFEVGVAMDARMDEVYAGCYRWQQGRWQVLQAPALLGLEAWSAAVAASRPHAIAGSAIAAFGARLHIPAGAAVLGGEHDRAAALLRLAVAAARAGDAVAAACALPLYLRDTVALTTHERAAARAAALPR